VVSVREQISGGAYHEWKSGYQWEWPTLCRETGIQGVGDEAWWQPQLELSFLAVFVQLADLKAWFAKNPCNDQHKIREQALLAWCSEHARTWAKWLT
jgi:hypothetical protein